MNKFAIAAVVCAVLGLGFAILAAFVVDELTYLESSGIDYFYRASGIELSDSGSGFVYSDWCSGGNDFCDYEERASTWILCNVFAVIIGGICGVIVLCVDVFQCCKTCACCGCCTKVNGLFIIIAGILELIALLSWEIDNPAYDNSDAVAGASIWLAAVSFVFFLVGGGLAIKASLVSAATSDV